MHYDVISLLPEAVEAYLGASILGRATSSGVISWRAVDLREFGTGRHRQLDDNPYGGGAGMVMMPGPLVEAIESCAVPDARVCRIALTPGGQRLDRDLARQLATDYDRLILLCGRFEGIDERVMEWIDLEVSLGDFVLTGGELGALAIVDATARLLPGALGNADSAGEESFEGPLLEYPHYTRPRTFRDRSVPDILLSGDHAKIAAWRRDRALERTAARRPERLADPAALPDSLAESIKRLDLGSTQE